MTSERDQYRQEALASVLVDVGVLNAFGGPPSIAWGERIEKALADRDYMVVEVQAGLGHAEERCPNRWKCRLSIGWPGYETKTLRSADRAAHYWVGCRRITSEEAARIRATNESGE